jgi:glycosyltransferase involved in cell wall biosynthesis
LVRRTKRRPTRADRRFPPGVDLPAERDWPAAEPRQLIFVGHFDIKGGDVALKAFDIVRQQCADMRLTIVGSTPRIAPQEAAQRGIEWIERVPRERLLNELMPAADIFVYPTRFDGLPLTLLEAMACGLAVATSDYRAIPEVVDHGGAGLLSPVDDARALAKNILKLLEPATNRRFSAAGRQRVIENYSRDVVREKLASAYNAAVSG